MRYVFALLFSLLTACAANEQPKTDAEAIVEAVLAHDSVSNYLHPEIAGRLPIAVALRSPPSTPLRARAFGHPVRVASLQDPHAIILGISTAGDKATVTLTYAQEGLGGNIGLHKRNGVWVVTSDELWERRSNNSFKPTPLRGAAY
jgi:hypothetical protein